ncbi:DUF6302 family protein [Streptomyces uncialis]|uniref:DUF6302 family protein n=1 Tax=Streptomyces uncialis TaxID=1048205 RepID=UPI0033EA3DB8
MSPALRLIRGGDRSRGTGPLPPQPPTAAPSTTPTLRADHDHFSARLHDIHLLHAAFPLTVGHTGEGYRHIRLAVPVGGHRRAGALRIHPDPDHDVIDILDQLGARAGFPRPRLRWPRQTGIVCVEWGEPVPDEPYAAAHLYGYHPHAADKYARTHTRSAPEGLW